MKFCILMGSPRKNGNTISLLKPFMEELSKADVQHDLIWLYDKEIKPCIACRTCQDILEDFGCPLEDDVQALANQILASDVIVFATPIYSWYCTPPMKSLLDRLVYGMNKFYGKERRAPLWKDKKVALITTCGYPEEAGTDLLKAGINRYCKHSKLKFMGMLNEHDPGYKVAFMDDQKEAHARRFAQDLLELM